MSARNIEEYVGKIVLLYMNDMEFIKKENAIIKKENKYLRQHNENLIQKINKLERIHHICELCYSESYGNEIYTCDVCKHTKCRDCIIDVNNHMDFWYICDANDCTYAVHINCTTKNKYENCGQCLTNGMLVELK